MIDVHGRRDISSTTALPTLQLIQLLQDRFHTRAIRQVAADVGIPHFTGGVDDVGGGEREFVAVFAGRPWTQAPNNRCVGVTVSKVRRYSSRIASRRRGRT